MHLINSKASPPTYSADWGFTTASTTVLLHCWKLSISDADDFTTPLKKSHFSCQNFEHQVLVSVVPSKLGNFPCLIDFPWQL